MQDQQYDVSPEMLKLFHKKEKERAASKKYYQNLITNPYRPINIGFPYDPNVYRYHAMTSYHASIWKPTIKSRLQLLGLLIPSFLYYWYLKNESKNKETALRSGILNIRNRIFFHTY